MGLFDTDNTSIYDVDNSSYDNIFYNEDDASWDDSWTTIFDDANNETEDTSWLGDVWDWVNTEEGMGLIAGAGAGLSTYLSDKQKEDQFDKNLSFSNQKLLQDQQQFEAKLALEAEAMALEQAKLNDKINTRARHNASINAPSGGSKKVSFG